MVRRIIQIDEEKCNGCGACADACHEGAIGMVDGKAKLLRDDYCDGLGDCLPACPVNAITFVEREAAAYDEEAVKAHLARRGQGGCEGSRAVEIEAVSAASSAGAIQSELRQWPIQIKLAPVNAPFFSGADVLIAADCTAYACGDFHSRFMRGKVTLIGCTKLDDTDYSDKLAEILRQNSVKSLTVARMDVPCCGGMEKAVREALLKSGRDIPCEVATIGRDGRILKTESLKAEAAPLLRRL